MSDSVSRRNVLRSTGALLAGAAVAHGADSQPADQDGAPLAMNPLGKTGVKVTRLGLGASTSDYDKRLLNYAHRRGVRYFDNADGYVGGKAERLLGEWVAKLPRREDAFVVTKSHAYDPDSFYRAVVHSLEQMQLDTIDLYFIHALTQPQIPLDRDGAWRKVKERLLKEKKVRFLGFSTHAEMSARAACLTNAAKGGWVDALMTACDPGLIRANPDFDRAIDACAKAGVGLVCMKTTRGLGRATRQPEKAKEAFQALGLTPFEAMLKAMWSDGRFACVCSEMANFRQIEENTATARAFTKPFDDADRKRLHDAIETLSRSTCPGCDGQCRQAAGTQTDFCSIARFLAYYEHDGKRERARELFRALPAEARSWEGADLCAASHACASHLDFADLLDRAKRLLA